MYVKSDVITMRFWKEHLRKNKLKLITPYGAFAYPFYAENAVEIRVKLVKKKLFIPTLWPNVLESTLENSVEYQYSSNILPLPCDQRYGEDDMEYIVRCINEEIEISTTMK